ncbi:MULTISPECIES: hypothetical protein [Salinibaculum]|uniref:hypothetical protein n=1 Tax=Salinibaculum TaxID=2732368 RepID=UPI0030CFF95A
MGFFEGVPVLRDVEDAAGTVATGALDAPADLANTLTGTGENTGWFGVIDRTLDPRASGVGSGEDTFAPGDAPGANGLLAGLGAGVNNTLAATFPGFAGTDSGGGDDSSDSGEESRMVLLAGAAVAAGVAVVGVLR